MLDYLLAERPPSRHRSLRLQPSAAWPATEQDQPRLGRQLARRASRPTAAALHTPRDSLAVHLLRSGETLKSIGDLLGHRCPDTTFIYTKLQVDDLRSVALDPAVVS